MLASTLLSAATALFFLPAVFSAPVAPVTSVSVSDASITISTTKSATIQKMTTVFVQKKSEFETYYASILDISKTPEFGSASEVCKHLAGMLQDTIKEVHDATTIGEDGAVVLVDVATLVEAIGGFLICVFDILVRVLKIFGSVHDEDFSFVAGVLLTVPSLLNQVVSVVGSVVLARVGEVGGLVGPIKYIVDHGVPGILEIVASLGIKLQ